MRLATRNGGQCAFCAFRASEWLNKSNGPFGRTSSVQLLSTASAGGLRNSQRQHWTRKQEPRGRRDNSLGRASTRGRDSKRWIPPDIRRVPQGPRLTGNAATNKDYFAPETTSSRENTTIGVFRRLLVEQVALLERRLLKEVRNGHDSMEDYNRARERVTNQLQNFEADVLDSCSSAQQGLTNRAQNPLFYRLRKAFLQGDLTVLSVELRNAYAQGLSGVEFKINAITNQEKLTDMSNPIDWFPATRAIQREVHLHVGPTNSGKTYHALKRLEQANTGVYAGPLRLLAHEVYSRFNAKGKACALITGEEHRVPENMKEYMTSCTVEMVPLNTDLDVAVIDEIQMLADQERGWAWTQALMGVKAKEIHLCGEDRATPLIEKLCALMGDKLIIHNYERLTPLRSASESLKGDLTKLEKGDAIILFSRVAIHAMKANIENTTGKRCAVVYGSLPPETRAQQAALFNDQNNDYDFLVASDAVGMGLNLSIKRVIFEATSKFDGLQYRLMGASNIKQIAGRAGRFKSAADAIKKDSTGINDEKTGDSSQPSPVGYVTTLENFDLPIVRAAMRNKVEPLKSAGIFPPSHIVERFAAYFPHGTSFSYILLRLHELASLDPLFFLCQLSEQIDVADLIQEFDLTVKERLVFIAAPIHLRDPGFAEMTKELASCVASKTTSGHILDLKTFNLELLERDIHDHAKGAKGFLREAESLHKAITLYLWLSYRIPGMFTSHALALHVKALTEQKIEECLSVFEYDPQAVKARNFLRKKQLAEQLKERSRRQDAIQNDDSATIHDVDNNVTEVSDSMNFAGLAEEDDLEEEADLKNVVDSKHESSRFVEKMTPGQPVVASALPETLQLQPESARP